MELNEKEKLAREKVCLPLDGLNTLEEVKERVEELSPFVGIFKIGKELFTRFGPEVVKIVQSYGSKFFLDLKYHDIPNTVKGAAKAATELKVSIFNIHASGGLEMMQAAVEGVKEGLKEHNTEIPKVIGVTVLTSLDEQSLSEDLNMPGTVNERVLLYAKLAEKAGLDGIVCAGPDLEFIKPHLPSDFIYVVPGIKHPKTDSIGTDQKRVFTPYNAIKDGASILVIGRAITGYETTEERKRAAHEVLQDIARALEAT